MFAKYKYITIYLFDKNHQFDLTVIFYWVNVYLVLFKEILRFSKFSFQCIIYLKMLNQSQRVVVEY